jgi:hypothetical protein
VKRYSIRGWERNREIEICQCDTNPWPLYEAVTRLTRPLDSASGKRRYVARYSDVRVVDNEAAGS